MKTIKLSVSSFWVKYWRFITGKEPSLPSNTCNFKRDLMLFTLLNILFLPLILVLQFCLLFIKDDFSQSPGKVGIVAISLIQGVAYLLAAGMKSSYLISVLLASLYMGIGIIVFVILMWGVLTLEEYYSNRPKKIKEFKEPSFVKTLYLSWKEKLCSKIEYEP